MSNFIDFLKNEIDNETIEKMIKLASLDIVPSRIIGYAIDDKYKRYLQCRLEEVNKEIDTVERVVWPNPDDPGAK